MVAVKTEFSEFVANDIKKYEGVRIPLKTGFLKRTFKKWTKCKNLHPNPDDEFCFPDIGPNYGIISDYEKKMKEEMSRGYSPWEGIDERLMVEAMHPEGYMLINGHHRWAAAVRLGVKKAPIKILNLTHEEDIINIVEKSKNSKRVTVDLNELVFVDEAKYPIEKKLPFPANRRFKQNIRLGFPALCRFLQAAGYDIWVFTPDFYSVDYIEELLKRHHIKPDGIITASGRLEKTNEDKKKRIKEIMKKKYTRTLNLYNDMIIAVENPSGDFEQIPIEVPADEWVMAVENAVKKLEENGKQ
ncbi:MAG: ParB N-terminal domain-containing protein [Lachnospiraceae bacterium]|nr:ParB N-terminal domain-containing protein [Lachnospiraceae bacterium]